MTQDGDPGSSECLARYLQLRDVGIARAAAEAAARAWSSSASMSASMSGKPGPRMHTSDTRRSGYGLSRYKVKRLFSNLKIICNADKDIFHTQPDSRCHTTIHKK